MSVFELRRPDLLLVEDERGQRSFGGDQLWYPKAGYIPGGACGATVASNMIVYLLRTRPGLYAAAETRRGTLGLAEPLSDAVNTKAGFMEFMKQVYPFFLPRAGGLMSDHFCEGMDFFANEYGLSCSTDSIIITVSRSKRQKSSDVSAFIRDSLYDDIPVAFLTLSAGQAEGLENWHWVTIIEYDDKAARAKIANNCVVTWTDVGVWLETSIMGGAFVSLRE